MASSNDRPNRPSTDKDNHNPFIAFKRYADEQLSSMLQSFLAFPSAFTSPSPNDRWKAFDEEARRRSLERDARLEQQDRERRSREEGPHGAADDSATYRDYVTYNIPAPLLSPIISGLFNYLAGQDEMPPASFQVVYAAMSPYSPLQLEDHEKLREYGMKWRHAFEDLMAVQNGLEMPSEAERAGQKPSSGAEWIRAMLERGTLGRWKPISSRPEQGAIRSKEMATRQPENDADEDGEFTELDLYQNFLGGQYPKSSSETPESAVESSSESTSAESMSRLLPDTPPATISTTDLLGRAINAARRAVENDNAGNYEEAHELYHQSLGHLFHAVEHEKNEEVTDSIWTKIHDYTDRARELEMFMEEEEEEDNEEDGSKPPAVGPTERVSTPHTFSDTDNDHGKPSIISILTTTEKRTLPDGTVHTKVVLKKRFADGNEESSETVHTTRGSELQDQAQTTQAGGVRDELAKKSAQEAKEEKSKKGWFWS